MTSIFELPIRVVRPSMSPRLPGHDPREMIEEVDETARLVRQVYRSKLKIDEHQKAERRRARIVAHLVAWTGEPVGAPYLQEALGISKRTMHADLKVMREAKRIGAKQFGRAWRYSAI